MSYWVAALSMLFAVLLPAQDGTAPKPAPADYPAHASLAKFSLGAEYMVHSYSSGRQAFIAKDYLVVEVALYPAKGERLIVDRSQFSLRVNGKKQALAPESPEFVAASVKYPDWETHPQLEAAAGPIILGRPQSPERFPGDPEATRRMPDPPGGPALDGTGVEREPPEAADRLAIATALSEREARVPLSGYLYFRYKGNVQHIRSLELNYAGPAGIVALPLL